MYKKILMEIENNTGNIYFYSQLLTQVTGFRPQIAKINLCCSWDGEKPAILKTRH